MSDQITKGLILQNFSYGDILVVIPSFFNLTLAFNKGVAFGLFSNLESNFFRMVLLSFLIGSALTLLGYFYFREYRNDFTARLALAAIFGGAVGNLIDRLRFGMVVDFLDFHVGVYHWPAFNIADSSICIGVAVLALRSLRSPTFLPVKSELE
jgi:signal peptidase II